jgi:hypothetical protein
VRAAPSFIVLTHVHYPFHSATPLFAAINQGSEIYIEVYCGTHRACDVMAAIKMMAAPDNRISLCQTTTDCCAHAGSRRLIVFLMIIIIL